MGGAWAYEALSFGGFWAWDPVENTSLVPWLNHGGRCSLTAHSAQQRWCNALCIIPSNLDFSSHSLFNLPHAFRRFGRQFCARLRRFRFEWPIINLPPLLHHRRPRVITVSATKGLPKKEKEDRMDSREFWMFIGALTLLISGLQITLSTSYPVFNKLFGPEGVSVHVVRPQQSPQRSH